MAIGTYLPTFSRKSTKQVMGWMGWDGMEGYIWDGSDRAGGETGDFDNMRVFLGIRTETYLVFLMGIYI